MSSESVTYVIVIRPQGLHDHPDYYRILGAVWPRGRYVEHLRRPRVSTVLLCPQAGGALCLLQFGPQMKVASTPLSQVLMLFNSRTRSAVAVDSCRLSVAYHLRLHDTEVAVGQPGTEKSLHDEEMNSWYSTHAAARFHRAWCSKMVGI
jgi:hypothetical protein